MHKHAKTDEFGIVEKKKNDLSFQVPKRPPFLSSFCCAVAVFSPIRVQLRTKFSMNSVCCLPVSDLHPVRSARFTQRTIPTSCIPTPDIRNTDGMPSYRYRRSLKLRSGPDVGRVFTHRVLIGGGVFMCAGDSS